MATKIQEMRAYAELLEAEVLNGHSRDELGGVTNILSRLFPGVGAAFGQSRDATRDELFAAQARGSPGVLSTLHLVFGRKVYAR